MRPASASAAKTSQSQSQSFGGRGVTVKDVLLVLRTALPSPFSSSSSSSSSAPPKRREPNPLLRNAAHTACNVLALSFLILSFLVLSDVLSY